MHPFSLGIIQGLTEFLPVSSSGHLLIVPALLGWPESGLTFDVALNTGTFLAAVCYFFPVWWDLLWGGLVKGNKEQRRTLGLLVLATIPAGLVGFVAQSFITGHLRLPVLAALMLIVFGLLLGYADRHKSTGTIDTMTWRQALAIGCAQVLALIPGVSRSGITLTTGLFHGFSREEATRFSFLLLAPISFGAAVTQIPAFAHAPAQPMVIGVVTSFLIGLAAIHFMLRFLQKYGLRPYVWYRVVAGVVFLFLLR